MVLVGSMLYLITIKSEKLFLSATHSVGYSMQPECTHSGSTDDADLNTPVAMICIPSPTSDDFRFSKQGIYIALRITTQQDNNRPIY